MAEAFALCVSVVCINFWQTMRLEISKTNTRPSSGQLNQSVTQSPHSTYSPPPAHNPLPVSATTPLFICPICLCPMQSASNHAFARHKTHFVCVEKKERRETRGRGRSEKQDGQGGGGRELNSWLAKSLLIVTSIFLLDLARVCLQPNP